MWGPLGKNIPRMCLWRETSLWRESCPGGASVDNLPDNARDRRDGMRALALADPLEDLLDVLYEVEITIRGDLTGGNTGYSSTISG